MPPNRPLRALLGCLLGFAAVQDAAAHGLMQDPPSRNWYCGALTQPDHVTNGQAQYPECRTAFDTNPTGSYNFMSVLTHGKGRAVVTPLPDNVCGFNAETFGGKSTPWDTPMNWPTSVVSEGRKTITWNITWGPHFSDTEEFRYWITKPDFVFSPNRALAWSDFESTEFCSLKYNDATPGANPAVTPDKAKNLIHTQCTLPKRSGRHVIYGEWGRNLHTYERFHGCLDVVYDSTPGVGVKAVIKLNPAVTEVTGAGALTLDASASQGSGLAYQWSIAAANPAHYTLEDATKPVARLKLAEPGSNTTVQIGLLVKNADGTSNATTSIAHKASVVSPWTDLGPLTANPRTLAAGDALSLRMVLKSGQDRYAPAPALKLTAANAGAAAWPLALAQAVNAANVGVRVGVLGGNGAVSPVADPILNRVYAASTGTVTAAYLQVASANPVSASYTINNDWTSGYCATIKVTNAGTATVKWTTSLKVQGTVTQLWNASWSQSGDTLSLAGPSWSPSLGPGEQFTGAGFCANR